ncbi:protein spinster-like [Sitophilus oryzae]|uniref:Protein spinster-like n=1 Tax=Sitophilus oryzae TaxID=7048 RepID=A0A6J2Y879_SITOR|nr:protein spinster-like [Sitophilus oryzae]
MGQMFDEYSALFIARDMLADIQKDLNINNDQGGLLQTAFIVFYMAFGPLFGFLGDRYSRKYLMAFGVFLWSLTTLAGSFMTNYWWFLLFRAMVGIGEASYSTIAPTILSDLFVGDMRSKMLALFYFAIPVGSGLGYIVGAETAKLFGKWHWALRVTPGLGAIAVVVIVFFLKEPERGASEGSGHMEATSWRRYCYIVKSNKSFMLSTAGFTCVAFVAGALSWWGPKYIEMGSALQGNYQTDTRGGMLLSCPFVFIAIFMARYSTGACFALVFFGELFLNLTWAIVADILLVSICTRRSTAEGFQLLMSHALGDAGSPYLVGVLSEAFAIMLTKHDSSSSTNSTLTTTISPSPTDEVSFKSLQYALFITCFVEILGGFFFLLNAFYLVEDREKAEQAIHAGTVQARQTNSTDPLAVDKSTENL